MNGEHEPGLPWALPAWRCPACGHAWLPEASACPACGAVGAERLALSGGGKLLLPPVVCNVAGDDPAGASLVLGLIELDEGPTALVEIVDSPPRRLEPGTTVTLTLRRVGCDESGARRYGYKAAVAPTTSARDS